MSSAGVVSIKAQVEGDADVKRLQQSLKGLKQETVGLNRPMDQAGRSIDGVGKSSTKVNTQVRTMGDRVQQAGTGMALAGAAAVSLWNAYDNVTDSAQRVTIAEGRLEGAERRLSVAREQLNKLQASGTASALDLQQAQQGIAAAQSMVERANLGLTNSQEALNEAWLNAATSIIPSVFTGVSGISQVYQALTTTVDESIDSYLRQASALQDSGVEMIEASGNTAEFAVANTEAASSVLEMSDAATEMGSSMTEISSSALEGASAISEVGSTVAETGADIGEFAGDATELGGALTEVGSAAIESGADLAEFGGDTLEAAGALTEVGSTALEAGANMTEFASDVTEAAGATVELGADVAEFSGDMLESAGNVTEASTGIAQFGAVAADTGDDFLSLGNDIGTMGGALVEAESAAVTTLIGYRQLKAEAQELGLTHKQLTPAIAGTEAATRTATAAVLPATAATVANTTATTTNTGALTAQGQAATKTAPQMGALATASTAAAGSQTALATASASTAPGLNAAGVAAGRAAPQIAAVGAAAGAATPPVAGLSVASRGLALPLGIAAAAIGGFVAISVAVEKNVWGLGDAFAGFADWLRDLLGAFPPLQAAFDTFVGGLVWVRQNLVGLLEQIPFLGDMIKGLGAEAESAETPMDGLGQSLATVDSSLSNLSPLVQDVARAWGLYGLETEKLTQGQQNQIAHMKKLDSEMQTARQGVVDLATANGVDLWTALNMTDEQMAQWLLTAGELGPTAQMQAEMSAEAAQKMADEWMTSFDQISSAQQEFASTMRSAMGKMGQELGEEMEVGLSDLEKTVSKGLVGFSDQFFEEIFPEDFLATAIIEGNDPDDIADELKDLMDDVVDEDIITKKQAKGMMQPMIDYFEQDLPPDVEEPLAYMAGQLPGYLADWEPAIVNGVVAVGAAGKNAVEQHIIQPMIQGLQGLSGGASGLDFGRGFLDSIRKSLPAIEAEAGPEIAELIQGLLDAKNLRLDEKVQGIIDVMDQIRPGFKETIMGMDADADGIADIMDDKVLTPIEQMKVGILSAFETIFRVMGKTDWANALQTEINETTGAVHDLGTQYADTSPAIQTINDQLATQQANLDATGNSAGLFLGKVKGFTQAEWDALTPIQKINAQLAAHQAHLDNVNTSAGTATTSLNTLKETWNADWGEGPTAGFTGLRSGAQGSEEGPAPKIPKKNPLKESFAKRITDAVAAIPGMITTAFTQTLPAIGAAIGEGLRGAATYISTTLQDPAFQSAVLTGIYNLFKGVSGLLAPIGQALWEGLVHTATWISSTLQNPQFQSAVLDGIYNLFTAVGSHLVSLGQFLWEGLVSTASWISTTLQDPQFQSAVLDGIWNLFQTIGGLLQPLGEQLWSGLVSTASWISTTLQDPAFHQSLIDGITWLFNQLGSWATKNPHVVAGFAAGGLVGALFANFAPEIQKWIPTIQEHLHNALVMAGQGIWDALQELGNLAQSGFNYLGANMPGWFATAITGLGQLLKTHIETETAPALHDTFLVDLPNAIQTALNTWPGRLGAMLGTALGTIGGLMIQALAAATDDLPDRLEAFFGTILPNAIGAVAQFFTDLFTDPGAMAQGITDGVAELPQAVTDAFAGVNFQDAFGKAFGEAFGNVGGSEAYQRLVGNVNSLLSWIKQGLNALPALIYQGITGLAGRFASYIAAGLTSAFSGAAEGIKNAIIGENGLWGQIKAGLSELPGMVGQWFSENPLVKGFADFFGLSSGTSVAPEVHPVSGFDPTGGMGGDIPGGGRLGQRGADKSAAGRARNKPTGGGAIDTSMFDAYKTALTDLLTHAQTVVTQLAVLWTGHAAAVGAQITAVVSGPLSSYARELVALRDGVTGIITQLAVLWVGHAAAVGAQVSATVGHMANLAREYVALGNGVQQVVVNSIVTSWSESRNGIASNINGIVQVMANLAREYVALGKGVAGIARNLIAAHNALKSEGSAAMSSLAGNIRNNMNSIVTEMSEATSAARTLKSAIGNLQSKTITVRTNYVTSGRARTPSTRRAATGFSGIVDQPTRIFAGEANRPELVQVTPLSAAGGRLSMNKSAATSAMAVSKTNNIFTTPTIRAGGSSGKHADRIIFTPDGQKVTYYANGNVKYGKFNPRFSDGRMSVKTKSIKEKGIKGTDALTKKDPESWEKATALERATDPLSRPGRLGGVVGRGGKSLFDLGIASSRVGGRYVVDEQRFEDGSYRRTYNDGSFEIGRDIYRLNTKYLKGKLKKGKSVKEVKYFANGKAEVTYYGEDKPHKMKHKHPGPFDQGGKKKKERYTTIAAGKGWRGFVNQPTQFLAGERGREYVDIQPIKDWANNMATNARSMAGGAGGGRPMVLEVHIHNVTKDGRELSEQIRKELLGGIYSMT